MRVTILGSGSSGGVPVVGIGWGRCDPGEPKNRRRRPSILIEAQGKVLLVDTSPDLRENSFWTPRLRISTPSSTPTGTTPITCMASMMISGASTGPWRRP